MKARRFASAHMHARARISLRAIKSTMGDFIAGKCAMVNDLSAVVAWATLPGERRERRDMAAFPY